MLTGLVTSADGRAASCGGARILKNFSCDIETCKQAVMCGTGGVPPPWHGLPKKKTSTVHVRPGTSVACHIRSFPRLISCRLPTLDHQVRSTGCWAPWPPVQGLIALRQWRPYRWNRGRRLRSSRGREEKEILTTERLERSQVALWCTPGWTNCSLMYLGFSGDVGRLLWASHGNESDLLQAEEEREEDGAAFRLTAPRWQRVESY